MNETIPRFKVGVYALHQNSNFNFQLNRTLHWGGGNLEQLREVSGKIKDTSSWERQFIALGEKALAEDRIPNAIAYLRMAEFFMFDDNPAKDEDLSQS